MLKEKTDILKTEISKMIFDKRAFCTVYASQMAEIANIKAESRKLKAILGEKLDIKMEAGLIEKMETLTMMKMQKIKTINRAIRHKLKKVRKDIKEEILAEPDYANQGGVELGLDVEGNIYPATVESNRTIFLDFEPLKVMDFDNGIYFLVWGSDFVLRVMDWGSLRVLGQIRVNVMKEVKHIYFNQRNIDFAKNKGGPHLFIMYSLFKLYLVC